jgi:hypothetical protein
MIGVRCGNGPEEQKSQRDGRNTHVISGPSVPGTSFPGEQSDTRDYPTGQPLAGFKRYRTAQSQKWKNFFRGSLNDLGW